MDFWGEAVIGFAILLNIYLLYYRPRNEQKESEQGGEYSGTKPIPETYGLFTFGGKRPSKEYNIDIVAVHGLGGHWERSWTAENEKLWLRDFLPFQMPNARIMSYGYNSETAFSKSITDINDEAAMLLDRLNGERHEAKTRPIIFISHSLGGIVVKKALVLAHERSSVYGDLLNSVQGTLFLGVPHRGADLAYLAKSAAIILEFAQFGFGTNPNFVAALQKNSRTFADISQQFVERAAQLTIRTFFETERLQNQLIVNKDSAVLGLANEIAVGIAGANHKTMCKFNDIHSQKYSPVWNAIKVLSDSAVNSASLGKKYELQGREAKLRTPESDATLLPRNFRIGFQSPYPVNLNFCGREHERQRICEILQVEECSQSLSADEGISRERRLGRKMVTLHGLGGVGKTQLALHHAHNFEKVYTSIFWINANSRNDFDLSISNIAFGIWAHCEQQDDIIFTRFARMLGFPDDRKPPAKVNHNASASRDIFKKWLSISENRDWLVIIDNSDSLDEKDQPWRPENEFLPNRDAGSVIITTRLRNRSGLGEFIEVKQMDKRPGCKLLLKSAGKGETKDQNEITEASKLVEVLGGLPIALAQAGAYIHATSSSFSEYLQRLDEDFSSIASKISVSDYAQLPFFQTWEISFKTLEKINHEAADLLRLCAFLNSVDIPEVLLQRGNIWGKEALNSAIETLVIFSLVQRSSFTSKFGARALTMHTLTHKWAHHHLEYHNKITCTKKVISIIGDAVSVHNNKTNQSDWIFQQEIQPHLMICYSNVELYLNGVVLEKETALAAHHIGKAFDDLSKYVLAEMFYRISLNGLEKSTSDGDDLDVVIVKKSLGKNLGYQSKYKESIEYLETVLKTYERLYGTGHTRYLSTLFSIGLLCRFDGKYDQAMANYQAVYAGYLQLKESSIGTHDTEVEIGHVQMLQGNYSAALEIFERALSGYKKTLESTHPFVLNTVHWVACAHRRLGNYTLAIEIYTCTLKDKEVVLGKEHLSTLSTVGGLAETHLLQGDYEEALKGYQRALKGRLNAAGEKSKWTLNARHSIANVYRLWGKYEIAALEYEQTLKGREEVLRRDHPDTLETVVGLIACYHALAQNEAVERLSSEYNIGECSARSKT